MLSSTLDNMKIKIKPYHTLRTRIKGQAFLEMDTDRTTVKGIIRQLSDQFGYDFRFEGVNGLRTEEDGHILILVNGRNLRNLPDGFHTDLKHGDEICLFPPVMGG